NEADEPKFTQPVLYKAIEAHDNPRKVYLNKLLAEGSIDDTTAGNEEKEFRDLLQHQLDEVKAEERFTEKIQMFNGAWEGLHIATEKETIAKTDTTVSKEELLQIGEAITTLPKDKKFFKKIEKLFQDRNAMVNTTHVFDWAMGELMAYGTLL